MINFFNILSRGFNAKESYFFLCGGQSNIGTNTTALLTGQTGRAPYASMPDFLKSQQEFVRVYYGLGFPKYTHEINADWGWLSKFLYDLGNQNQSDVFFYKFGQGGRQLSQTSGFGTIYERSILTRNGLAAWNIFKIKNKNPRIFFLWCQGETDASFEFTAIQYQQNLTDFFFQIRNLFNQDMDIIYNNVSNNATGHTFRSIVSEAQFNVSLLSPKNHIVNADNLEFSDPSHFSSNGYLELSDRYLEKFNEIL